MNEKHLHILASPWFLISLSLLLLNDFIFKHQFHNELTGKLSDFAGLFVFPLFWAAFFPRLKSPIYILTAILFIFWKSAYSQFLINAWNSLPFFMIERTVDYSDLLALLALPFSYAYSRGIFDFQIPLRALYMIAMVSLFAFTATQFSHRTSYNKEYLFQVSKKELLDKMSRLPVNEVNHPLFKGDTFEIRFDSCTGEASITVHESEKQSVVTLKEIDYRCPSGADNRKMLEYFEKEFISKLREEPVRKSPQVLYIWASPSNNSFNRNVNSGAFIYNRDGFKVVSASG